MIFTDKKKIRLNCLICAIAAAALGMFFFITALNSDNVSVGVLMLLLCLGFSTFSLCRMKTFDRNIYSPTEPLSPRLKKKLEAERSHHAEKENGRYKGFREEVKSDIYSSLMEAASQIGINPINIEADMRSAEVFRTLTSSLFIGEYFTVCISSGDVFLIRNDMIKAAAPYIESQDMYMNLMYTSTLQRFFIQLHTADDKHYKFNVRDMADRLVIEAYKNKAKLPEDCELYNYPD